MRFGIDTAQQRMTWDELVGRVQFGEQLGFDGAWGFDHFQPMYGEGPGECFEGMTTLAALSGVTTRIRLGLLVAGVTYRHPSLFATQALTIDHASHGRLEMSLGAAWFEAEHRALGIPFPRTGERFDLLEEALEVVTRLMTGERVSFPGKHVQLQDAQVRPLPVQQPHPPIWIGGSGMRRTLPIAAKYADAWHTWGAPDQMAVMSHHLDDLAEQCGRDPSSIVRASSLSLSEPWDQVRRNIEGMRKVGMQYLVCGWPSEGRSRVEEFATKVMPDYTG
ncbi:MAG: putative Luciferase family protein [Actinomycetia bacterium]|jgi:F420-dependent oxidoreductase-like protein|nr:putative Luciferase family protein [Actinomycetes bacterium]